MSKFVKVSVLSVALLALPVLVLAQVGPQPSPTLTTAPITGVGTSLQEVQNIIVRVANFLIAISLFIALIFIIVGGIRYMMAGSDDTKVASARATIWNGIIGAAVVLAIGVILSTLSNVIARTFFG